MKINQIININFLIFKLKIILYSATTESDEMMMDWANIQFFRADTKWSNNTIITDIYRNTEFSEIYHSGKKRFYSSISVKLSEIRKKKKPCRKFLLFSSCTLPVRYNSVQYSTHNSLVNYQCMIGQIIEINYLKNKFFMINIQLFFTFIFSN